MNHLSKLQSEAVKELDNKIKNIIASGWMCCDKEGDGCNCYKRALLTKVKAIKDIIADQIQKAYSRGREEVLKELRVRIDTWGGLEDDGGNLCHYDSQIIEYLDDLSIQSKGK